MGEIVRLQKYIAMSGVASRRAAETMIQEGRVKVNGKKITEQGVKIEIGADNVSVDDKPIKLKNKEYLCHSFMGYWICFNRKRPI